MDEFIKKIRYLFSKFTNEENSLTFKNLFNKKWKYYYSAVIHDKDASNKIDKMFPHISMLCPREIDGIDKIQIIFKRYNPKNPYKGGAKKSDYWNKEKLYCILNCLGKILNKNQRKKELTRVSSKSLLEQKIEALKKGDTELAKTLDRR